MPKIISRQPTWLGRSSPAHSLFHGVSAPEYHEEPLSSVDNIEAPGLRTLAHRGSEVFVANGKSVRWADLASMKADYEADAGHAQQEFRGDNNSSFDSQFRVLEFKYIVEPIMQLSISPNESLLAIVTAHTVHVCEIPDSSYLSEPNHGPLNPKTIMVGNTIHVLSSTRITNALWHPLGVAGNCLVTVTTDAVVRLWELNMQNRSTAEQPSLAVDLRKLRNATSTNDDVLPARLGISQGISYDSLGMEVASACFGGLGSEEEIGWNCMTLWVAMTEGDVYALCPLLPSKWQACAGVLPNLAATILAEKDQQEDTSVDGEFLMQYQWLSEQESLPAMQASRTHEFRPADWIYTRPNNLGAIPKLQGPFSIVPGDLEFELALADIHVVASRLQNPGHEANKVTGMPVTMVYLLTQLASVYACLDLEGVHGQWLPQSAPENDESDDCHVPELAVLSAVDTFKESNKNAANLAGWPTFTADLSSPYSLYVTNSQGIWYLSAKHWIENMESEMSASTTAGTGFRVGVGLEGSRLERQKLIALLEREEDQPSAPLIIHDSDLGHLVLTVHEGTAQAAILDSPYTNIENITSSEPQVKQEPHDDDDDDDAFAASIRVPLRAAYVPSKVFREDLHPLKDKLKKPLGGNTKLNQIHMSETIRLSPAILELMTHDHRILSDETHKLGLAIADLFTRCNMMQAEFKAQIQNVREIAQKVDHLGESNQGDNIDQSSPSRETASETGLGHRVDAARKRQSELLKRFESLRRKTATFERPLSDREKSWVGEVDRAARDIDETSDEREQSIDESGRGSRMSQVSNVRQETRFLRRYNEARGLTQELCSQVDSALKTNRSSSENPDNSRSTSPSGSVVNFSTSRGLRVPADVRKQKLSALEGSMERQTALLDATMERLERLGIEL